MIYLQVKIRTCRKKSMLAIIYHPFFGRALPPSALHVFYGTRKADIDDELPKYNSWLSSQWAFLKLLRAAG